MPHYTLPTSVVILINEAFESFLEEDGVNGELFGMHKPIDRFLLEMSREEEAVQEGLKEVLTAFVIKGDYIHRPCMRTKTLWEKKMREKFQGRWALDASVIMSSEGEDVERIISLMMDVYEAASKCQRTWFLIDWDEVSPLVQQEVGYHLSSLSLWLQEEPIKEFPPSNDDWTKRLYFEELATETLLGQNGWHGLDFEASMDKALTSLTANSVLEERHHAELKDMSRSVHASAKQKQG